MASLTPSLYFFTFKAVRCTSLKAILVFLQPRHAWLNITNHKNKVYLHAALNYFSIAVAMLGNISL